MEGRSVTLAGFPRSISTVKLKFLIEKRITSPGTIESVQKGSENVLLTFKDEEGLQKFYNAAITDIEFGQIKYPIRVIKQEPKNDPSPPQQNLQTPTSGNEKPRASTPPAAEHGPQSLSPKSPKADAQTQEKLIKSTHFWSSLSQLPAAEGIMCVLAQNINPDTHIQKIRLHFESKRRSNGGPVACFVNMIDGLLVVFENAADCKSCLEMSDQKLGDKDLAVFPKMIPKFHNKKFVVEGVGPNTTEDTLIMFLESCMEDEIPPKSCTKQKIPGVYLVEYGQDVSMDASVKAKLLWRIESQKLEGNKLKAKSLLRTDCLKVSGIPLDVSNDQIRLVFESKKRTGGGSVTRIDRVENHSALVYLALYEDAERIFEKSKASGGSVIINQHPVAVQMYYHSLARDHENIIKDFQPTPAPNSDSPKDGETHQLQPFLFEPKCDENLLNFICGREKHLGILKTVFDRFAAIEVIKKEETILLKCTSRKPLSKMSQKDFEAKCEKQLENHFSKYSASSANFDKKKLEKARSLKLYPQIEEAYTSENNEDLVVNWKPNEATVQLLGLKEAVDHMMEHITKWINSTVDTKTFNENQFGILLHCGIIADLRQKYGNLQIKHDANDLSVTFIGPDSDVHTAQIDALTAMMIDKKRLSGLDEIVLKFLSESMQKSPEITSKILGKLKLNGVKAVIALDDNEPCIKPKSDEEFKKALQVIKEYIMVDIMKTDEAKSNVIESEEWTTFRQTLGDTGLFAIYIKTGENITLVGTMSEVKVIRVKIKRFLDDNAIKKFFIRAEYGKAKFVIERSREFTPEMCKQKKIECGLSPEDHGGISVKGKKSALDIAHREVRKLLQEIIEKSFTLEKPGIKEYYSSEDGKQFLGNVERVSNCVILTGSRENPEWVEYNRKRPPVVRKRDAQSSPVDFREEELFAATLPNTSVSLAVWKTDITKHKCDVIVNASNPELMLLPGGVSGVIKNLDIRNDDQIQNEMSEIMKKRGNYGTLLAGEAAITTAGNLPGCKKIVHAIGPRWHDQSQRMPPGLVLKSSISRSLEEVENAKLKSIAIPAISCGVFGGQVPVCIPLIVEAVEEYFKDKQNCCIKKVHFVENSRQDVIDEFVSCIKKFKPRKVTPPKQQIPTQDDIPSSSGLASSSQSSAGACTVNLEQGDIAAQKADVIVNATDPNHLLTMAHGPAISQILAQRAGPAVQQECSRLPGPYKVGSVFETSGGGLSCKKLYHALVTHYNPQTSPSIIQAVVSRAMAMADNSGYTSIVFPAIATGGFQHPPNVVAKLMRQEILNFSGKHLRNVTILLYPQNHAAINAFNAEFNSSVPVNPPSPPTKSRFKFTPHKEKPATRKKTSTRKSSFEIIDGSSVTFGELIVAVQEGDITAQDSDVIVNSTNSSFDLNRGMVSTQILRKGGPRIQDEAFEAAAAQKRDDDYVVTSGNKLKCRKIIHLVTPQDPKDLQNKIIKILKEVEKLKMKSVCMPAFGTGMLNMDIETVGSIMNASIQQFVKTNKTLRHLKIVTIVIFDTRVLESFKTGFFNPNLKKGLLERLLGWGGAWLGRLTSSPQEAHEEWEKWEKLPLIETSLNLFVYSTSKDDAQQAIDAITVEEKKVVQRTVIEDNAISRLTDWEKYEILETAKRHNIAITEDSNRYLSRLIVEGLTKEVMRAHEAVKDILREFSAAETCATYVVWQKKTAAGKWEDYHPRSAAVLEKAYNSARTSGGGGNNAPTQVRVPEFHQDKVTEHIVDISLLDGNQKGKSPQVKRKIKERSTSDIPDFWDDMKGQQLMHVQLQPGSQEYQNVLTKFTTTGQVFHRSIVSIERIQNLSLYKQYVAKKSEVTDKRSSFQGQIEHSLFHGTSDDEKIILHGFDRSYAGKNNILYGRGVYFATDPGFSHTYAAPDAQDLRKMFLADVITGEYCVGNNTMVAPPQRTNSPIRNDLFDSTVNNATNPTIFVIFKDASAYPSYRITYT